MKDTWWYVVGQFYWICNSYPFYRVYFIFLSLNYGNERGKYLADGICHFQNLIQSEYQGLTIIYYLKSDALLYFHSFFVVVLHVTLSQLILFLFNVRQISQCTLCLYSLTSADRQMPLLLLLLLLLLLCMLLFSRSKDLWKITCISSLCLIDKLSFHLFQSSASPSSSQYHLLFLKWSWSCVLLPTSFNFIICPSMTSWRRQISS